MVTGFHYLVAQEALFQIAWLVMRYEFLLLWSFGIFYLLALRFVNFAKAMFALTKLWSPPFSSCNDFIKFSFGLPWPFRCAATICWWIWCRSVLLPLVVCYHWLDGGAEKSLVSLEQRAWQPTGWSGCFSPNGALSRFSKNLRDCHSVRENIK